MKKIFVAMASAGALFAFSAGAAFADTVIYDAVPATLAPNYPSQPFQAQQTNEFGDYVHLGGSARNLTTITFTMSDWAVASSPENVAFCAANATNCDSTGFFWPITVNVYSNHLGANGAPDQLLATKTVTQHIIWRPATSANCTGSSAGDWQAADNNCYGGIATNITFDLSSLNVTLPNDVIVTLAYNTETYGANPVGVDGPYDSLNVAVPPSDPVAVGTDDSADKVFWNTDKASYYTNKSCLGGTLCEDTNWTPYGTVAMKISAIGPSVTTDAATNVTTSDATMNATNGPIAAGMDSFWVSTSTINTSSPVIPVGVYSTKVLPAVGANANFSATLASLAAPNGAVVHGQVSGSMPAITQGMTYYYVAWVNVNGTWYPGNQESVTIPLPTYTVTIDKYLDGKMATASDAKNAAFPMVSSWNAVNLGGAGSGSYTLSPTGFNSSKAYEAITSPMNAGSSYATNEVTTGNSVVDASCGHKVDSKLVGYTWGTSLSAAAAMHVSKSAPNFTNLAANEFVIVWNKTCRDSKITVTNDNHAIVETDTSSDSNSGGNIVGNAGGNGGNHGSDGGSSSGNNSVVTGSSSSNSNSTTVVNSNFTIGGIHF